MAEPRRPRCLEHAWQLRSEIRKRHPQLELGGWANPIAGALIGAGSVVYFALAWITGGMDREDVLVLLRRKKVEDGQ